MIKNHTFDYMNKFQNLIFIAFLNFFCLNYSFSQADTKIIVGAGITKPLNFETLAKSNFDFSGTLGIDFLFLDSDQKFRPKGQILFNHRNISAVKFQNGYESKIRNYSGRLFAGYSYTPIAKVDTHVLLGGGANKYTESNSDQSYTTIFRQSGLDARLGVNYNLVEILTIGFITEYGITKRQKTYQRVGPIGEIFKQEAGLNPLTFELIFSIQL